MAQSSDEDFKIIVMNFGKWKDRKPLDELLTANNIKYVRIQKTRLMSFGFVVFETKEERDAAIPQLEILDWFGEKLEVKAALPKKSLKPLHNELRQKSQEHRKKRSHSESEREEHHEGKEDTLGVESQNNPPKDARDVVTPWAEVPYEEQLQQKEAEMKKVLVKIVRQTRKEYAKKEKRVHQEQKVLNRKQKKEGESGEVLSLPSVLVPEWLHSHGSLYLVANEVLYLKRNEAKESDSWLEVADAKDVLAIVSFGSELVAANKDGFLYELKFGAWCKLCEGPNDEITSLASLRGFLLCCTAGGKILKMEGSGRFASCEWKELASLQGAQEIVLHNGFVYCHTPTNSESKWYRAPLVADALDSLAFEVCSVGADNALGLASHDAKLILLTQDSLLFMEEDSSLKKKVSLNMKAKDMKLSGFASHKGLCCPMDSIHASPATEEYRNKCEFSIGFDHDNKPCVGFRLGLFRDGSIIVSKPDNCLNVPQEMKAVCSAVQKLIEKTSVPVYDIQTQKGVWRMLTVRYSGRTRELMVMIQVNPTGYEEDVWSELKNIIVSELTTSSLPFKITSLYLQEYAGVSAPKEDDPIEKVYGSETIEEELLGMRFKISPQAFFQVNTQGAETLYSLVNKSANLNENSLLYDVCCGTGTIGICASKRAGKVVGIEICKAATDDAAINAELNGIKNITFVNSKAEDVMKDLLRAKRSEEEKYLNNVVTIVDPPRAGLHHKVIKALRGCPPLKRIVYVSCNPTGSLVQDSIMLCGPNTKSIQGKAFRPVHAIPVDMFPHTPHCEMIIVFERIE
jgi:tRNA (uracil-5-)-methyltransferase